MVNHSYITPNAAEVAVILINTTDKNIWIYQLVLAASIYNIVLHPWQYHTMLHREMNSIKIRFQGVKKPPYQSSRGRNKMKPSEEESSSPLPPSGLCPDTNKDYNFKDKVV